MPDRIPINSASFQERFPKVYRDFFAKYPIVCSSPRSISWTGAYVARAGGLTIQHPIPIRTYVGIAPDASGTIRIERYTAFDPLLQQFQEYKNEVDPIRQRRIMQELGPYLAAQFGKPLTSGYRIGILAELPQNRALGAVGALFSPLVVSMFLAENRLDAATIAGWRTMHTDALIRTTDAAFNAVFRAIWMWEMLCYATASGASVIAALLPTMSPICYASVRPTMDGALRKRVDAHRLRLEDLDAMRPSRYWAVRAHEVYGDLEGWPLPLDYGVLSVRGSREVIETVMALRSRADDIMGAVSAMHPLFTALFGGQTDALPRCVELARLSSRDAVWRAYLDAQHLLTLEAADAFAAVLVHGFAQERLRNLATAMNAMHVGTQLLNVTVPALDAVRGAFLQHAQRITGAGVVGAKLVSSGRGGNLLFATSGSALRSWFHEILEELHASIQEKVTLDYCSWMDGAADDGGLRVEQDLRHGVSASVVPRDAMLCTYHHDDGHVSQQLCAEANLPTSRHLIVDTIHHRMMVSGEAVTSKEIPTQRATVDLLAALLAAPGNMLNNGELPRNSYTTSRNELQGKITAPLKKLVRERCGKDLRLKITGDLTKFRITLDPTGLDIVVIRPLHPPPPNVASKTPPEPLP